MLYEQAEGAGGSNAAPGNSNDPATSLGIKPPIVLHGSDSFCS